MGSFDSFTTERTRLLPTDGERQQQTAASISNSALEHRVAKGENCLPVTILPLSLLAALAMAATAATTIFAYADLICKDPKDCQHEERNMYAGAVAAATCAANIGSMLALGTLERLSKKNYKVSLILWFALRSMSVAMLLIGCRRSILPFSHSDGGD